MNRPSTPNLDTVAAELHVIADTVERQRDRVGGLAEGFLGTDRDDVVTMIHEAERQLLIAGRAIHRAIRTLDQ